MNKSRVIEAIISLNSQFDAGITSIELKPEAYEELRRITVGSFMFKRPDLITFTICGIELKKQEVTNGTPDCPYIKK